jgi:hypothetical protein
LLFVKNAFRETSPAAATSFSFQLVKLPDELANASKTINRTHSVDPTERDMDSPSLPQHSAAGVSDEQARLCEFAITIDTHPAKIDS